MLAKPDIIKKMYKSVLLLNFACLFLVPLAVNANEHQVVSQVVLPDYAKIYEKSIKSVVLINGNKLKSVANKAKNVNSANKKTTPQENKATTKDKKNDSPSKNEVYSVVAVNGSGFIITSDGYIITNAHVVEDAFNLVVTLADKRTFKTKVIGYDKVTDIALLKIDEHNLPVLQIGNVDSIRTGDRAVAIGAPFGLRNTFTAGVISETKRYTGSYLLPSIQTDISINPGNSGGPLINMQGQVIGVNTRIHTRNGGYVGISYSIAIDEALKVVNQLKQVGYVKRGKLGLSLKPITSKAAIALGLKNANVAFVSNVIKDSTAEKAGIEVGDIVVAVNGAEFDDYYDVMRIVYNSEPNSTVDLTILRNGKQQKITAVVEDADNKKNVVKTAKDLLPEFNTTELSLNSLGLVVRDLTQREQQKFRIKAGAYVISSSGIANKFNIKADSVIISVANKPVKNAKQLHEIIAQHPADTPIGLVVRKVNNASYILISLD